MTRTTKTILTAAVLLLINFNVQAADIEQGTFSIGGTSNLLFRQDESSIYEKMKENTDYDEGKYHNTTNRLTTQFKLKFYF